MQVCSFIFNDSEKNEFCMKNHLTLNDDSFWRIQNGYFFLLNFVANLFLYYTGYRWWTVNANFSEINSILFSKAEDFYEKENCYVALRKTGYNRKQKYTPGVCFYKSNEKAEKQKEKSEKEKQSECGEMTGQKKNKVQQ